MRRASPLAAVTLCVAAAACQNSPTQPPPVPRDPDLLSPGRYMLSVTTGGTFPGSVDSLDARCTGRMDSWGLFGPHVDTAVRLSVDGDGWIARPELAEDGNLELRLQRTSGSGTEWEMSGRLRGSVVNFFDRFSLSPPRSLSITGTAEDGSASLTGSVQIPLGLIARATGEITFSHTAGTTVTCPEVRLHAYRIGH